MKARTLIVFALALGALAGAAHAEMSAQQIIARMEQQRGKIKDYTAEL
jgi:outer membrane lipoprotein-sorting protein